MLYVQGLRARDLPKMIEFEIRALILLGLQGNDLQILEVRILKGLCRVFARNEVVRWNSRPR